MKVSELVEQVELKVEAAAEQLDTEVTGGFSGDLISTVIANAKEGNVWVTWHVHPNIVAAALIAKLSAIILVCGRKPEQETIDKAQQEGVPILVSSMTIFETVGRLYKLGISGVA